MRLLLFTRDTIGKHRADELIERQSWMFQMVAEGPETPGELREVASP